MPTWVFKSFLLILFLSLLGFFYFFPTHPSLISLFPIEKYDQNPAAWIKANDTYYQKTLLSEEEQKRHHLLFLAHYVGKFSPWNEKYISKILEKSAPDDIKSIEKSIIANFNNLGKSELARGYGANFRPYPPAWIIHLAFNIQLSQFENLHFQAKKRAIAIDNLDARVLPTEDPHFYDYNRAGQGFPFDNLQMSVVWAGTPIYVLGETRDHAWSFVLTPELIGWVKSRGIAFTSGHFVRTWTHASGKQLAAITQPETSISDQHQQFYFLVSPGAVFPAKKMSRGIQILLPAADLHQQAILRSSLVSPSTVALIPLAATPEHFSNLLQALLGRPYSWGGKNFYNDCSAELKSLFTPFGIWLPRHSTDQPFAGKIDDLSEKSPKNRLSYLMDKGHAFMTLVYIGGHVLLYLGNYQDPSHHQAIALSYQNMWGLSPFPANRRAVIGQAVIFPLLLKYSEDKRLRSQVSKRYFQLSYLDQAPSGELLNLPSLRTLMRI